MLRWAGGVTLKDKVRNEHIRGSFQVAPITEKITETRLRWFEHVQRRHDGHIVKKCLFMTTQKRGKGRPRTTRMTNVQKEMNECGLSVTMQNSGIDGALKSRKPTSRNGIRRGPRRRRTIP